MIGKTVRSSPLDDVAEAIIPPRTLLAVAKQEARQTMNKFRLLSVA